MPVTKGPDWNKWAKTKEERFFKTYYVFLKQVVGPFSRYEVYCDQMELNKQYWWNTLHYLINKSRRDGWNIRHRNIRYLYACNSKNEVLLQLTDILLGCHFATAISTPKNSIRNMVMDSRHKRKFRS